jgi:hypothetical protein
MHAGRCPLGLVENTPVPLFRGERWSATRGAVGAAATRVARIGEPGRCPKRHKSHKAIYTVPRPPLRTHCSASGFTAQGLPRHVFQRLSSR